VLLPACHACGIAFDGERSVVYEIFIGPQLTISWRRCQREGALIIVHPRFRAHGSSGTARRNCSHVAVYSVDGVCNAMGEFQTTYRLKLARAQYPNSSGRACITTFCASLGSRCTEPYHDVYNFTWWRSSGTDCLFAAILASDGAQAPARRTFVPGVWPKPDANSEGGTQSADCGLAWADAE